MDTTMSAIMGSRIEKEFVAYKQALELKALGFNDYCLTSYLNGNLQTETSEIFWFQHSYRSHKKQEFVSAPTFSQAFRWFREKHKLQHHIWSGKLNHIFYGYDVLNIEEQDLVVNNSDIGGGDCDYETYEEAELACLNKLIEIVKL